jgi:hypothetical protein
LERTAVNSTNVRAIGYDAQTQTLEIEYASGMIYQYFDVSESVYLEVINSSSVGTAVNTIIKGSFRYSKQ